MNLSKFLHFSFAEQSLCVLRNDKQQFGRRLLNELSLNANLEAEVTLELVLPAIWPWDGVICFTHNRVMCVFSLTKGALKDLAAFQLWSSDQDAMEVSYYNGSICKKYCRRLNLYQLISLINFSLSNDSGFPLLMV